jgi:hypothetical protein
MSFVQEDSMWEESKSNPQCGPVTINTSEAMLCQGMAPGTKQGEGKTKGSYAYPYQNQDGKAPANVSSAVLVKNKNGASWTTLIGQEIHGLISI